MASIILFGRRYWRTIFADRVFQITRLWFSSPEARNRPFGLIEIALTVLVWNVNSIEI